MSDEIQLDPELEKLLDQNVTFRGRARNGLHGAVIVPYDRVPVFLEGMTAWGRIMSGKKVEVTGVLRRRKLAPDAHVVEFDGSGEAVVCDVYVIENPTWKHLFY